MLKRSFIRTAAAAALSMLAFTACKKKSGIPDDATYTVQGVLTGNAGDSLYLYDVLGSDLRKILAIELEKPEDGGGKTFVFGGKLEKGFYYIGTDESNGTLIILGDEKEVKVSADASNIDGTITFENSPANTSFKSFSTKMEGFRDEMQMLSQNLQIFMQTDPKQAEKINGQMEATYAIQTAYVDSVINSGGFNGMIAQFFQQTPYNDSIQKIYKTEEDYLIQSFMGHLQLDNPSLGYVPSFYQTGTYYTQTLLSMGMDEKKVDSLLHAYFLDKTKPGTRTEQIAWLSVVDGVISAGSDLIFTYGEQYKQKFPADAETISLTDSVMTVLAPFKNGNVAPDFTLNSADGKSMNLHSVKGKVILIDFWASWCVPCRQENPMVVQIYNYYKSRGLEIVGVSLDTDNDAWKGAIKSDGLKWIHLSDLKGWDGEVVKQYNIGAIPRTLLLDSEYKILGKNLRGESLVGRLQQLLGV